MRTTAAAGKRRVLRRIPAPTRIAKKGSDEDEMARLGRGRPAEPGGEERRHRDADHAQRERACLASRRVTRPTSARSEHDGEDRPAPGAEVAGRLPQVRDDRPRAAELRAAAADADVEAAREDEVGEPERRCPATTTAAKASDRLPEPVAPRREHEHRLGGEHERAVRVRGDGQQDRSAPERPGPPAAAVERAQQEHEREQGEEEEQAVHPRVDAVEEEDPAAGDERRRDQRRPAVGESPAEKRDEREARRPRTRPRRGAGCRGRGRDGRPHRRRGSGAGRRRARACTCSTTPARLSRPTKSARVSSSCGGHAISWWRRNAVAGSGDRADPDPERVGGDECARRGARTGGARGGFGGLGHRS